MSLLNKRVSKTSISLKIFVIILVFLLPLNTLSLMAVNKAITKVKTNTELMIQNIADVQMAHLEEQMDNSLSLLFYIQEKDSNCLKMLRQQDDEYEYTNAKLKTYYQLKDMASMINGGEGYFFYMQNKEDFLIYNSVYGEKAYEAWLSEYIQESTERPEHNGGWKILEYDGAEYLVLMIKYPHYAYGTWISLENFISETIQNVSYDGCAVSFHTVKPEQKQNVLSAVSYKSQIYLEITLPERVVLESLTGYERLLIILCLIYLLCMPILYLVLKKMLIIPLHQIRDAHNEIKNGKEDYRITKVGKSREYQEIYEGFNRMVDNLNLLRVEVYEKEIARQRMELQSLQFQIRPHFLLNTFNLIFSLAQRGETEMIQETIIYLSDYFRHIFKSSDLELFSKELHLLEGYRNLVNISHEGKVEIILDFEPEISLMRFPPLLLLAFLENAVSHAFDPGKILHINMQGDYAGDLVTFWIIDDGNGMSEEDMIRLNEMFEGKWKPENPKQHIGLYNSFQRLQYFFGPKADIAVDVTEDGYTTFRIQIPYSLEVSDEIINCE